MNIHTYPLGQMQSNCYLLEKDMKVILIDPGDSADFLLEQIQIKRFELVGMIATHGHFDHIMAVGEIQLTYPHIPLYVHFKDMFLLKRVIKTAHHFLGYEPIIVPIRSIQNIQEGQFRISDFEFLILHTPGHTPGSCSLYNEVENMLFSGDTLFKSSIGRYDFSYSDKDALKNSLQNILKFPKETVVYPGHGIETSIEDELHIVQTFF